MLYFIVGLCLICWFLGIFAYAYVMGRVQPFRDQDVVILIEALLWPATILFYGAIWIIAAPFFLVHKFYNQGRNDYYKNFYKKSS